MLKEKGKMWFSQNQLDQPNDNWLMRVPPHAPSSFQILPAPCPARLELKGGTPPSAIGGQCRASAGNRENKKQNQEIRSDTSWFKSGGRDILSLCHPLWQVRRLKGRLEFEALDEALGGHRDSRARAKAWTTWGSMESRDGWANAVVTIYVPFEWL